jgi:hypothetical protein
MKLAVLLLVACSSAPNRNVPPDTGIPPDTGVPADSGVPRDTGGGDGPPCQAHCGDEPEPVALSVSALGVALSSVPGRSVVTRTLAVTASRGTAVAWTAEADQPWLQVTPRGTTAGSLTVTADPTGLAADHQYLGAVVVRSTAPGVHNEQRVRVGLWVGSAAPATVTLPIFVSSIVADPVTTELYTSTGSDIVIYDAYRGVVVRTFTAAVGGAGNMAISSDGLTLFVNDRIARAVVALDTGDGHELRRFAWNTTLSEGVAYARPDAHPLLLIGAGDVFDADTGARRTARTNGGYDNSVSFAVAPDSAHVFAQDRGLNPAGLTRYEVTYDERGVEPLTIGSFGSVRIGSYGQGLCVGADGSRIYSAKSAPYVFEVYAPDDLSLRTSLAGDAYPVNAACGWNGLFFGGNDGQVWVYRADDAPVDVFALRAAAGTMVLSGDNTRITGSFSDFSTGRASFEIRNTPNP